MSYVSIECAAAECNRVCPPAIPLVCRGHLVLMDMVLIRELLLAIRSRRFQGDAATREVTEKVRQHVHDTIEAGNFGTYAKGDKLPPGHWGEGGREYPSKFDVKQRARAE